jgi:Alkylmercury lyase
MLDWVSGGDGMEVEIKTAEELVDPVLEARWMARREAPLTDVLQAVLRAFRDRGGPVSLDAITVALPGVPPAVVRERLVALNEEDLIQLKGDRVEIAYPFSAIPTVFRIRFADGAERHACCAIDALGMAPMLGEPVHIASRCHHCVAHLALEVEPDGVGPDSEEVMVWVGKRAEGQCRITTTL